MQFHPTATEAEARRAGDAIDSLIEREAQIAGVGKCILVLPKDHPYLPESDWKEVRVYERKIPNAVATHGITSGSTATDSKRYLN